MTKKFKKIFVGIIASAMCAMSSVGVISIGLNNFTVPQPSI